MEKPILFNGEMVRAILDGRKSQTRRIVKGIPDNAILPRYYGAFGPYRERSEGLPQNAPREAIAHSIGWFSSEAGDVWDAWTCDDKDRIRCPFGKPGELLWVRETWAAREHQDDCKPSEIPKGSKIYYTATPELGLLNCTKHRPSIFMPRWASRINLEITGVRVERLQDISEEDAKAEGVKMCEGGGFDYHANDYAQGFSPRSSFFTLWESINGAGSWDKNPWVWVVEFKHVNKA